MKQQHQAFSKFINNQKGSGLIQSVIATGIMTMVLGTALFSIRMMLKFETRLSLKEDFRAMTTEIEFLMKDPAQCLALLGTTTVNTGLGPGNFQDINMGGDLNGTSPPTDYETNRMTINDIDIELLGSSGTNRFASHIVVYAEPVTAIRQIPFAPKEISVIIETNPAASDIIINCSTFSIDQNIPSGIVSAFNLVSCPPGWTTHLAAEGRVIIGVGSGNDSINPIEIFNLGDTAGEYHHQLTTNELASHSHNLHLDTIAAGAGGSGYSPVADDGIGAILATGGDQAHINIQPYLSLLYCEKD